jgi:disulfide bond formation protein DsbB
MPHRFFVICDLFAVAIINVILWSALYIQFTQYELPCPLCLAQRMGLLGISFGYVLNLYFGTRARHYALSAIIALLTATFAILQILMHIVPETGGYGSPLFGMHLYTLVFIICILFIVGNLVLIILLNELPFISKTCKKIALIVVIPLIICILTNAISAFAQCGLNRCPPDPKSYWIDTYLKANDIKKDSTKKHHSGKKKHDSSSLE